MRRMDIHHVIGRSLLKDSPGNRHREFQPVEATGRAVGQNVVQKPGVHLVTELDELSLVIEYDSCRTRFALAWNPGHD